MALLLAVVGLYGVMAYTVSQRIHEMGIRMALWASVGEIRRRVLLQNARLLATGLAVGTVVAALLTRLVQSQLCGVNPTDPSTFAALTLMAAAALLASYLPGREATKVDPMMALRQE